MSRAQLDKKPVDVASMFDTVAEKYDVTNDVLSLGQDRLWRRAVVKAVAARRGEHDAIRSGLLAAGVASLGFLGAQFLAWRELATSGRFTAADPATAFFYLLTAIHGLHVLGGLVALCRTTIKAFVLSGARTPRALGELTLSVKLCAVYWHFLLLVWLVLFSLLMRWVDDLVEICRGLLT